MVGLFVLQFSTTNFYNQFLQPISTTNDRRMQQRFCNVIAHVTSLPSRAAQPSSKAAAAGCRCCLPSLSLLAAVAESWVCSQSLLAGAAGFAGTLVVGPDTTHAVAWRSTLAEVP